ncbi:glutathione S-transferase family protein [Hoeflea prorocentri]|uniref:Glutathione S-transferase family protein n=1 Tax=Hoeflea prorocentri TaxID=1922333 RepID=A0A9X3UHT0_9HYPH|nr:glutathione S-transferase family protein [Hoeflea prorocentri]MCY6381098.1 glutathione S-transferase family protein [Hoeflea prorocentri]MDA5398898.1 glutathione S-transferase family protein [Hoeflea prorocentri]
MLTLLGRRTSSNVQKVAWLLAELDIEHRHIELGGAFGGLDTPEFRMMNPHGKVPVLKDGDLVVWESHAILHYLAAAYGAGRFWSEDPGERSQVDQWVDWAQTVLQPDFLLGVFWGFYRTPEEHRDCDAIDKAVERCASHFKLVDRLLEEKDWLLAPEPTLADIVIGTHLYRYFELEIQRPEILNVRKWYDRLQQRETYRQHVMVPFDELYGRLSF